MFTRMGSHMYRSLSESSGSHVHNLNTDEAFKNETAHLTSSVSENVLQKASKNVFIYCEARIKTEVGTFWQIL
jgi:hypothetical protein